MFSPFKQVNLDGHARDGQTVIRDHSVQTFSVSIRCSGITVCPDVLKRLIEQRFEVVSIGKTEQTDFVRNP